MARRMPRQPWIREERLPTVEELQWVASPAGEAVCAEMASGERADSAAGIERWRRRIESWQVAAAWSQVVLRASARGKFSRADTMLLDRVALEQSTDEVIATCKASRFAQFGRVADLCCGLGGDALAIAGACDVVALDWSASRVFMAAHNALVYGRSITTEIADVVFARPTADAAHIDPDRRAGGVRSHRPEEASPGAATLERVIEQYRNVAVKLSPGADFEAFGPDREIELISHNGECRQEVVWTGALRTALRRATALPSGESLAAETEADLAWPDAEAVRPGRILCEPDPAVVRAHLVGVLARRHALAPIDARIAYLVGEAAPKTALVRSFLVDHVAPWSLKTAKAWLDAADVGTLEIKTRGFAGRPDDLLKRLRPGGSKPAVLLLTRVGDKPTAIFARRL